jgi:protein-S-isoprenylcysteine O-methyltransferase Ste14
MRIPLIGRVVDERFLNHRLRSTSLGGIAGTFVAVGLFEYRYFHDHVWSWDLLSVAVTVVGVKLAVMGWYLLTD